MNKVIEVTYGTGTNTTELAAFDAALFEAGIGNYNLLHLSSIIPIGYTPVVKKVDYNNNGEFGHKMHVVLSEKRESRVGHAAWAGLGWVTSVRPLTRGLFVEHNGEAEKEVIRDIRKSLTGMVEYRKEEYGPIQYKVVGITCENNPVCALAAAIYARERW